MSSQGETDTRLLLGSTLSNTRLLVIGAIFGIAILIAVSIKDNNLKVCFWLSFVLFIVALINLNLSVSFYIKLRNEKGIQGPRGEKGDKGPKGFPGRCELNLEAQCGIRNCRVKAQERLMNKCSNYRDIVNKRDIDRDVEEQKLLRKYKQWLDIIDENCNNEDIADEENYFNELFNDSEKYCLV
jgi:hypothetical protein